MTTTPQVSVVMGVYNAAPCLTECIDSILTQEGVVLELIVIDDGSSDGSAEIIDQYGETDPRVRVIHQENQGLSKALIRGCAMAAAPYIARQDADDRSRPGRLASQFAMLEADPALAMVGSWTQYVGPGKEPLYVAERPADPEEATRQLLKHRQGPPAHGCVMFRRSAYEAAGGYREEFYYAQDVDLWFRMLERGQVAYVQKVLYEYQYHPASISGGRRPMQRQFGALAHACREAREEGQPEAPYVEQAAQLAADARSGNQPSSTGAGYYHLGSLLLEQSPASARPYLWQAVRLNPFRPKHWFQWIRAMLTRRGKAE